MPECNILVVLWTIFLYFADALPQGATQASLCTTTSEYYGIATTVTDYDDFIESLSSMYSTTTFTGSEVPVHTTVTDFPGIGVITAYGYYDADALRSAGISIISGVTTFVGSCSTATLPPSPTGSLCEPHGDHWHCQPLSTATTSQSPGIPSECEPHDDHWHCPPGVTPPITLPSPPLASSPSGVSQSETSPALTLAPPSGACEPHGDHWHCPEGIPEPTTPPPLTLMPTLSPSEKCEPHGDHWHCSEGIPEPTNTTPPSLTPEPPSPTECSPHGDHWHCPEGIPEPTKPQPTAHPENACIPHDDHWHCPSGISEPANSPPAASSTASVMDAGIAECVPHGDHWHCPEGVAEPSAPPAATLGVKPTVTVDGECVPHDDHWHCPEGVPEPSFLPTRSVSLMGSEPTGSPIQFEGGAGALYGVNTVNSLATRMVTGLFGVVVVAGLV
ncbi:hypothetical protein BS50DRAFT_651240 [Corynespora cassiicola Philippines]|uniref:Uncharacterized protein n=1 Tax=Corynespora cassiicola Philippines TaxID=1448308 RepID=A0A2T2N8Q8_CORCC|nr:hypothetical protein BS50DRAFT_651240 [Corynespora cassiicola Philippines]